MSDSRKDQLALFVGDKKRRATRANVEPSAVDAPGPVEPVVAESPEVVEEPVSASPEVTEASADSLSLESGAPTHRAERSIPTGPTGSIRSRNTGELFLFPKERRPGRDMHFSRRMSDLVRRLQLLEREAKGSLGLTLPQSYAIHALKDATSLRMQELAETLGLAQSTVTRLVAPLKRMGLLDRRPDRHDGRATRAFLTERGISVVDELETSDRDLYTEILAQLPETRRADVVAAIELIHEAVRNITIE